MFFLLVHPDNLLSDVGRRGAHSADRQKDVIVKKVPSEDLDLFRKRGAEHEGLTHACS